MTDDRTLDAALSHWAKFETGDQAAVQRIISCADAFAAENPRNTNQKMRWLPILGGIGAIAASIAFAITLLSPQQMGTAPSPYGEYRGEQLASFSDPSLDSFAMLHTATYEEEIYL